MTQEDLAVFRQMLSDVMETKMTSVHGEFKLIKQELAQIKEQTTKTNGRVNKLEEKEDNRTGMWFILKVVGAIVVSVTGLIIAYYQLIN